MALARNGADGAGGVGTAGEVLEQMRAANAEAVASDGGGSVAAADAGASGGAMFGWDVEAAAPMEVLSLRAPRRRTLPRGDGSSSSSGGDEADDSSGSDESSGSEEGGDDGRVRSLPVAQAHVLELASAKLEALQAAGEMAVALMGVDGVLVDGR